MTAVPPPVPPEIVAVAPGWTRSDYIAHTGGPSYRLLWWSDTEVGFEHRCDRGDRGVIICAPRLTDVGRQGGHQVTWSNRASELRVVVTVTPSILCPDCGTHGFITDGRWRDV